MSLLARGNVVLERVLARLLVGLVATMALTVIWQVATRLYSRLAGGLAWLPQLQPSQWTEELAGFLLAWVALLGAAYALRRGEHVGLDSLVNALQPRWQKAAARFAQACVLLFAAILVVGGGWLVRLTLELGQTTPALHWSMGWVYAVAPLSGLLMLCFAAERVFIDAGAHDA